MRKGRCIQHSATGTIVDIPHPKFDGVRSIRVVGVGRARIIRLKLFHSHSINHVNETWTIEVHNKNDTGKYGVRLSIDGKLPYLDAVTAAIEAIYKVKDNPEFYR